MTEDPFLTLVAEALASAGRDVEVDASLLTIDVASADPTIGSVLCVVRPVARAMTFYVVHPTSVPAAALPEVGSLVLRATADLLDAALELDLATASLAYRVPVLLGDLEVAAEPLGLLLIAAVETVEATAARYRGLVEAVVAGELDGAAAAAAARRAPVEDLQAELDDLEP